VSDKRDIRQGIKQLQRVKTWQLVILLILASLLAATFLRLNNIGMLERRNAVIAADTSGTADEIHDRLYDLQRYTSQHMNANTGQFYLEGQYKRDSQKAIEAGKSNEDPASGVHAKAAAVCDGQFAAWSQAYVQCFVSELDKYPGAATDSAVVDLPKPDLYRHEYLAPTWSPDFAGLAVVICIVLGFVIVARATGILALKILLRRHYSAV